MSNLSLYHNIKKNLSEHFVYVCGAIAISIHGKEPREPFMLRVYFNDIVLWFKNRISSDIT